MCCTIKKYVNSTKQLVTSVSLFCSTHPACVQELRQNEIIDRLKAFSITPDPGSVIEVKAGEGRRLVISYSADSLLYGGVHDLPILVRNMFGAVDPPVFCLASIFTSNKTFEN